MPQINQLTAVSAVAAGDNFPLYSSSNGDARRVSASVLKSYMQDGFDVATEKVTQYAAPSATGFSVAITDGSDSIWLILTPVAGYAAGTIVLPALANCVDKQEVLVNCTQSVTTLTVSGNGSTVTGAPTTLAANAFFRLRFDDVVNVWYRVG
jgi:hypothetical protein